MYSSPSPPAISHSSLAPPLQVHSWIFAPLAVPLLTMFRHLPWISIAPSWLRPASPTSPGEVAGGKDHCWLGSPLVHCQIWILLPLAELLSVSSRHLESQYDSTSPVPAW